ncbi:MAG: CopD family protein [Gammaproteobacteria bacterium]|nr:CopD family protein [Gammaproteobacteria bacterium]
MLNALALILHLIAINIWVGGSFFAIVILGRAIRNIEAGQQHTLWLLVFRRFFAWAWLAVFILLASGTWMIYSVYGGFDAIPAYVTLMGLLAALMVANYNFIYFVPYRQYQRMVRIGDIDACVKKLAVIRVVGVINMVLGICIIVTIGSRAYLL